MSKKRESVRGKGMDIPPTPGKGMAVFTRAEVAPKKEKGDSRTIETKKSRIIYEQANYQILPEQALKIRKYAVDHNMKVSALVRVILQDWLKKEGL